MFAFCCFGLDRGQPFFQGFDLLVEAVVALLELQPGDDALNAHLQQAVLFCVDRGQVLLNPADILRVVVFVRDSSENGHHRVDDSLLVLRQLVKDFGHDLI